MTAAEKTEITVIFGPTATGKSALAAEYAARCGGAVVSADSMQIYRGLDIATAKPEPELLALAPHRLIGFVAPERAYTVADYVKDAHREIDALSAQGIHPVLAGGTGMYISALTEGITFSQTAFDPQIRQQLNERADEFGLEALYSQLLAADPETAGKIHPNDRKRIVRALEYLEAAGEPISRQVQRSHTGARYSPRMFYLNFADRGALYARCDARVDAMLTAGLLDEARTVYDNRAVYSGVLQAIGFKEFFPYFENSASLKACVLLLKQRTRNYAKRQISWFNRYDSAVMLEASLPREQLLQAVMQR